MLGSFITVSVLTFAAKGVSFFKDATVAQRFGTGDALDAFMLAFGFVSFAASVLAGGLPEAFLPLHSELSHRRGLRRSQRLAVQCTLAHAASLLGVGALIYGFAPDLVRLTGTGFSPAKQALASEFMRALLVFMFCYGMSEQLCTWLRAEKSFALATGAPMLVPVCIIASLLATGGAPSIRVLTIGTNAGAMLLVLVLGVALWRQIPRAAAWKWRCLTHWEPDLRRVLGNAGPFLISGVIFSSSVIVDQAMAAWLTPGSVAVLSYSEKLCGLVMALTAGSAGSALFPYFADAVARRDWPGLRRQMFGSTGAILLFAVPMVLALQLLAPLVVRVLFERGAFDAESTSRVAGVLRFSALQIPFYITGMLVSRIAVSMQATGLMMVLAVGAVAVNAVLNWIFMRWIGLAGIPLSTAIVHLLSTVAVSWWVLRAISQRMNQPAGTAVKEAQS